MSAGPIAQPGVVHFSSNYELYASMSNRFSATLRQFAPRVEVYSIDESFLDLTGVRQDFNALGWQIKNTVQQWTGLGIGVGIGSRLLPSTNIRNQNLVRFLILTERLMHFQTSYFLNQQRLNLSPQFTHFHISPPYLLAASMWVVVGCFLLRW